MSSVRLYYLESHADMRILLTSCLLYLIFGSSTFLSRSNMFIFDGLNPLFILVF
jgi:hypothetical protein